MKITTLGLASLLAMSCNGRVAPDPNGGSSGRGGLGGDDQDPGNDQDPGGSECGECTSDADCGGGVCSSAAGVCLPWCDCPACDVCAGNCDDCVCPALWEPVCGDDGQTYGNDCEARCAGAGVACEGECPCGDESFCGDGVCNQDPATGTGEDCQTCPADCGDCGCVPSPDGGELCGDRLDNDCDGLVDEDCP